MDPRKLTLFQPYDGPSRYGASSFASYLIIGPVCFCLGIIFSSFPYDYPLLWTGQPVSAAYYDQLEIHLKHIHNSPAIVIRILQIVITVGFIGFFVKLYKPSEANLLFDGASLALYVVAIIVFISNTVKGLRIVDAGIYSVPAEAEEAGAVVLGREDSLKVLAASNTILALVFVGVLVLQAGQWYAEKKERQEQAKFEEDAAARKEAGGSAAAGKAVAGKNGRETRSVSAKKKQ